MIVSHCIMLQFIQIGAMRAANNTDLAPALLARLRAGAVSVSRTLLHWVTKLERLKRRNEARDKEVREAAAKTQTAATPAPEPATQRPPNAPVAPPHQPHPSPPIQTPVANGRAASPAGGPPPVMAAGPRPAATGQMPHVPAGDLRMTT
jgi:hypothetical protein